MKKVHVLVAITLTLTFAPSGFGQKRTKQNKPWSEGGPAPEWSQEGQRRARAAKQRAAAAYTAKYAARLAQCRAEQGPPKERSLDTFNLNIMLDNYSTKELLLTFGPPCLVRHYPEPKYKSMYDVLETWYYADFWIDGSVQSWISMDIRRRALPEEVWRRALRPPY